MFIKLTTVNGDNIEILPQKIVAIAKEKKGSVLFLKSNQESFYIKETPLVIKNAIKRELNIR